MLFQIWKSGCNCKHLPHFFQDRQKESSQLELPRIVMIENGYPWFLINPDQKKKSRFVLKTGFVS